jgi:hypothetical protein
LFVEAYPDKTVKAMSWIQFEAYLPTNEHTYDYSKDELITFGAASGVEGRQQGLVERAMNASSSVLPTADRELGGATHTRHAPSS